MQLLLLSVCDFFWVIICVHRLRRVSRHRHHRRVSLRPRIPSRAIGCPLTNGYCCFCCCYRCWCCVSPMNDSPMMCGCLPMNGRSSYCRFLRSLAVEWRCVWDAELLFRYSRVLHYWVVWHCLRGCCSCVCHFLRVWHCCCECCLYVRL